MEDSEPKTEIKQPTPTDLADSNASSTDHDIPKDDSTNKDTLTKEDPTVESSGNEKTTEDTGPGSAASDNPQKPTEQGQETMQATECDAVSELDVPYMAPMDDPLDKAAKFLAKHDIFGLLQNITAGIAYKRPADALQFMIGEIEKLQEEDRRRQGVITRTSSAKSSEIQQTTEENEIQQEKNEM